MKKNVFISHTDFKTDSLEVTQKILKVLRAEGNHLKRIEDFIEPHFYLQGTFSRETQLNEMLGTWLKSDLTYDSFFKDYTVQKHLCREIHFDVFENHSHLQQQANNALSEFRKTGKEEYLFRYKKLIGEIRSLLLDTLLKVERIAKSLKVCYAMGPDIDFRRIYRQRIKMLSCNTDDEAHVVIFFSLNHKLFLNKKNNKKQHENSTYTSLHHRLGGHYPGRQQPDQPTEISLTTCYRTAA
ncbi:hypothetical protein [Mucilaginibacter sp. NFX135]|uniref:hypothetical protein n=1 Tax=Mucilaginibacter sp. NFX135 TaxID=3402687 RepID=UPI003AFA083E